MKVKSRKFVILAILVTLGTILAYYWFSKSIYFQIFFSWSRHNIGLFVIVLFLLKILGIVWPPLPGGVFTLAAIPFVGWFPAYLVDFIGSTAGSSIAFLIGKKYGYPFLQKLFDEDTISKIRHLRIKPHREIEAITTLRIFTGSLFLEAICYGAGLLNVRFTSFFIGSIISHLIVGIPSFYLIGGLFNLNNLIFGVLGFAIIIPIFVKLKGRFLE
ncbi:MAG: VTT domain-containing protein [Patescibacteria group bacterium]